MKLSIKGLAVEESATLAISAKAKALKAQGLDVIDFGVGEPDFNTPDYIKQAGMDAITKNMTRYTPATGTLDLRNAICEKFLADNALRYTPRQIVVSNGAKHALTNAFMAILDPGDEVIIPAPFWVSYPEMVKLADGVPVFVHAGEDQGFVPTAAQIEAAITQRTKAILINNPVNPTGGAYDLDELEKIARLAVTHDLFVVSDEIYEELLYDGAVARSIASFGEQIKERTIIINGVSKTYAMTGWRIGYTASSAEVAAVIGNIQSQATSNPNSIAQHASAVALRGDKAVVRAMVTEFDRRRHRITELANAIPGISAPLPKGAFYLFMNVQGLLGKRYGDTLIADSFELASLLLQESQVATVPGGPFGAEGYLRLSYAMSMEGIEAGMSRIAEFAAKIH